MKDWVLHFEAAIRDAVTRFAGQLPAGARLLDAGAGEGAYRHAFPRQRYTGVDLGIGDAAWNYHSLDAVADLLALPFPDATFDAALNIVTLEHVTDPAGVLAELGRVLLPGGRLLLVVPQEWEVHQAPHDYFRYTRYGCRLLLDRAGFEIEEIVAAGGYFRLLSRRLLLGHKLFPPPLGWLWLAAVALPALLLPLLDPLDRRRDFTLGYLCLARRRGPQSEAQYGHAQTP